MIKVFDIHIGQAEDILIEDTAKGDLLVSTTGDGTFSGERISGKVLPLGMCATYTPSKGFNLVHAPLVLETNDGAKLLMRLDAYLHLAQELEDKMLAGDKVPPDAYYYKGTASFDVGNPKYKWLENRLFICNGIIDDWKSLRFTVYEA